MNKQTDSLVIDKIKKHVNIMINDAYKEEVTHLIFLNKVSKTSTDEETIKEFLELKSNSFIPTAMYVSEDNTIFRALNVNNICYVSEHSDSLIKITKEVFLIFVNGVKLKVAIDNELAESNTRVIDYLNSSSKFLEFKHRNSLLYVNKDLVANVTEIE